LPGAELVVGAEQLPLKEKTALQKYLPEVRSEREVRYQRLGPVLFFVCLSSEGFQQGHAKSAKEG
jgi:hypothetical protein